MIEKMRANYLRVAKSLKDQGWSDEEIAEYAESIKSAVDSGDAERIDNARVHLEAMVEPLMDINERVWAAIEAKRAAAEQAA